MNPSRKLAMSAGLFALSLLLVAAAAATQSVAPLFVAWLPLVLVAWVLTRPGPDWEPSTGASTEEDERTRTNQTDSTPTRDEETN
jgi:ABC-type sugar transport system substrate-binding protein